jgi:hypothetical protein
LNREMHMCNSSNKIEKEAHYGSQDPGSRSTSNQGSTNYDGSSTISIRTNFPCMKTSLDTQALVELPVCTVCLRRIQWSVSGVEGANDVPVSMWFRGNTGG